MNTKVININYIIDGDMTVVPTKMFYIESTSDNYDYEKIYFEFNYRKSNIISAFCESTDLAIVHLQKALSDNIHIACCQSCKHGNFCPFGNEDNEIFCFKDRKPNNKRDVCGYFASEDGWIDNKKRLRKLLDYCKDYKPINNDEYYTYNDWEW